jgi:hypothetical protein
MSEQPSPVIGLHGPIYVTRDQLDRALADLNRVAVRQLLGDEPNDLERIAYQLLKAGGHLRD